MRRVIELLSKVRLFLKSVLGYCFLGSIFCINRADLEKLKVLTTGKRLLRLGWNVITVEGEIIAG